jgi:hypothetical protein
MPSIDREASPHGMPGVASYKDVWAPGTGPGAATSLIIRLSTGTTTVAGTNRLAPIEPINARLSRPIA